MVKASAFVEKCRYPLAEGWGYIWGAVGGIHTQKAQDRATRAQTKQYGQRWVGKHVLDCSGLLYWALKELGGSIYHGANTIWRRHCSAQGELVKGARDDGQPMRPGTAVFLNRDGDRHHVGVYVGGGTVIEAKGTQWGVTTSRLRDWDEWGELKAVEYDLEGTSTADLCRGDSGEEVKQLQEKLIAMGYDCGSTGADGKFGTNTEKAVKAFQAVSGLTPDGVAGPATLTTLSAAEAQTEPASEPDAEEDDEGAPTQPLTADRMLRILWADYQRRMGEVVK